MSDCHAALMAAGLAAPTPVRVVMKGDVDLEEIVVSRVPILLRDYASDWPAVNAALQGKKHFVDYLMTFEDGAIVPISAGPAHLDGRVYYSQDFRGLNAERGTAKMSTLIAQIATHGNAEPPPLIYLASTDIEDCLPGFQRENDLALEGRKPLVSAWIGTKSRVAAHNDLPLNLAVCVSGKRRFTMFPPDQTANLYVGPFEHTPAGRPISLVDFAAPDLDLYPNFEKAMHTAQFADLEPGDVLFMPSMWWHHVEAEGDFNMLVNYWWRDVPAWLGTPQDVLMHAMMTLRDLPAEERQIWRDVFDHYVFGGSEPAVDHVPEIIQGNLAPMTEDMAQRIRKFLVNRLNR